MSNTEEELRRIWGGNFDKYMDRVVTNYDTLLNDRAKAKFDSGGVDEVLAVALLNDVAYRDPKHPRHSEASRRVSAFYQQAAGDDDQYPFQ